MRQRIHRWPNEFPYVMGVEEETGLMVNHGMAWEDPNILAESLRDYIPDEIAFSGKRRLFLQNGGLIYAGGAADANGEDNIERATPECSNIPDVISYTQANERLMVDIAMNYATDMSAAYGGPTRVRIQRRVVDSHGNRKACHDNFGINNPFEFENQKQAPLVGHLATRSFITGAGHVTSHGLRFAQKIHGLENVTGYGYEGYMYRTVGANGYSDTTGDRLEIRCSDINISPWAATMRLGSVALLIASLDTPLHDKIYGISPAWDSIELAKNMNIVPLDEDGAFRPAKDTYAAVDFQERLADIYLDELQLYTELPIEYFAIAQELKRYCEDYRKVLKNEEPITLLADRSDMAAKFAQILHRHPGFLKDPAKHLLAARDDLLYDYIGVSVEPDTAARVRYGTGYKLRENGAFKFSVSKLAIDRAFTTPPSDTRAKVRGNTIKNYRVSGVDWDRIEVTSEKFTTVHLTDPLNHMIDQETADALGQNAVRR